MTITFSTNLLVLTNGIGVQEAIDMRLISVCAVDQNDPDKVLLTLSGNNSIFSTNSRELDINYITSPTYTTGQDLADAINAYRITLSSSGSADLRAEAGVVVGAGDNVISYSSALSGTDWVISIISDTGWNITAKDTDGFTINMIDATTISYISTPIQ